MIGLSIHSDAIRAVRGKFAGGKFHLKQTGEAPLLENTIVGGELIDEEAFAGVLASLKEEMKIGDDEEVYVGLPNGIFKIDSFYERAEGMTTRSLQNRVYESGVDKSFAVRFVYMSGEFRIDEEDFVRHGMTEEQIRARIDKQLDENSEQKKKFVMIRAVTYAAAQEQKLSAYEKAFAASGYRTYCLEPEAVARIRYLINDTTQPFMFVDMEYDYATFVGFSENVGMFMLNASGIGFGSMMIQRTDEEGNDIDVLNRTAVGKFLGFANLAMDFFAKMPITGEQKTEQIVFFDGSLDELIAETENEFLDSEVLLAEEMLPAELSEKKLGAIIPPDFFLYYLPICLCGNTRKTFTVDEMETRIETDFLTEQTKDKDMFRQIKKMMTKASYAAAIAASLYFATVIGTNAISIVQAGYLQATPPEVIQKYETAKTNGDKLKQEIGKLNAIAKKRDLFVPMIDSVMTARPDDVYVTNFTLSGKTQKSRRIIIECMTTNVDSPQEFVNRISKVAGLEKARVLSQQSKDGRTAFQIVVPLQNAKESAENERANKRNRSANHDKDKKE